MQTNVSARKLRNIGSRSRADAVFPLTPTLSLRGREHRSQSLGISGRARPAAKLTILLPLPEGEGRGEGEQATRLSRLLVNSPRRRAGWYFTIFLAVSQFALPGWTHAADGVVYQGSQGPGQGKHIVLLAGDEEYRSEEGLPMLAKILAMRHGFKCTVLFPINPADGTIDPLTLTNMPGLAALDSADLCVMGLRFRELPDQQMKHFVDYLNAGKPDRKSVV